VKRGLDLANALAFLLALGLASAGASLGTEQPGPDVVRSVDARPALVSEPLPDGRRALRDAEGVLVPLADYRRIASGTLVADRVLADVCERDRIVAFTRYSARTREGHRYAGVQAISGHDPLENMVALRPDLLIVSELFDASYARRLREQGVALFDLGPMRGVETLVRSIHAIGLLIGAPERAAAYAESFSRRMRAVARDGQLPKATRALYLSLYGNRLFGGGKDTSYHDVIAFAGLRDVGAEAGLTGWPELTGEAVLAIDPDVVITRTGMAPLVCRHPGLSELRPCRGEGRLIELEGALLDDPGPGMLDATEALRSAALSP
jgi:iron complex transport system substrate-binding protein